MTPQEYAANIAQALDVQDQSVRLKAAMAAGTHPHPDLLETLVRRCGVEPDFFVREALAWALTRQAADDDLARTAWRAAAALAPIEEHAALATELSREFGRGDTGVQMALSVALLGLGDVAVPAVRAAIRSSDDAVSEHARATDLLRTRPDLAFSGAVEEAKRIVALGGGTC